jgi:hypothetical protein
MIAYASRTGTPRNITVLRRAGWRMMISAKMVRRPNGFAYALDNGAWHAFLHCRPFDEAAFLEAYRELGAGADFCVLPDIVGDGQRSLEFSLSWLSRLGDCPLYLAVQDGMEADNVMPIGGIAGIFVGGTSAWKEASLPTWGRLAKAKGVRLHVGRVNTARRIHLCEAAGADSFDGSSVSRYALTLPLLENARQQMGFRWDCC